MLYREAEHDTYVSEHNQLSSTQLPLTVQAEVHHNPTSKSSTTITTSTTRSSAKAKDGIADDESGDDEDYDYYDGDYEPEEPVVTSLYPARRVATSVPFEPYHMSLYPTKVVLTWWKTPKRRIVVQV